MIEENRQETPMGRVWLIVFMSMCAVLGVSFLWHVSGMNDQVARNSAMDDEVIMNTGRIALYRDMVKEKGKDAAANSLATSSLNIYGN